MTHLHTAAELCGGRLGLAKALGLSKQAVGHWFTGKRDIPPEQCVEIERITGGKVTRRDLRPDIFGPISIPRRAMRAEAA